MDLKFIESDYNYPVALLGDIKIYFNHDKSKEDARTKWNERKLRINYDNLFVIMYDRDGISYDDILKLENVQCKNKLVLTTKNYSDIDYALQIKVKGNKANAEQYLEKKFIGKRTFEKYFDFVSCINCE
jgi:uncharacterized protein (DUF1919 family)